MNATLSEPSWIPDRITSDDRDGDRCRWVDVAGLRFTDPFFESTLMRRRREPGAERWSPLADLHDEAASVADVRDITFVFHVSRCGSTLLSQLFGLDEGTTVLSEAPLLDTILKSRRADRERLFAATLRLLGRSRAGEGRLVVKTDCWHLFHAATLRRLYPRAAFILLYRSPAAVLDSHRRMRGRHMVPGLLADAPFVGEFDAERMDLDAYGALVLEQYYRQMIDLAADRASLVVGYEEGFPAAFLRAAKWLGRSFDAATRQRIDERCAHDAKRPHEPFAGGRVPALPGVDLGVLDGLYAVLEARRVGAS